MWRTSCYLLKRSVTSTGKVKMMSEQAGRWVNGSSRLTVGHYFSSGSSNNKDGSGGIVSQEEAKRLMRLVNEEELKRKLGVEGKEVIRYSELVRTCQSIGLAKTPEEAVSFTKVLDEAGVIWLFRDKVYLHPHKVVEEIRRAVPLALLTEDDPTKEELTSLQVKKEEIDAVAHKQVRRILLTGLGFAILQMGLFFRLTFWEFSWDVMEPITFFVTTTGAIIGYAYFLFTSRDPTYQDLFQRLFLSRQRNLIHKYNFDVQRFVELQRKYKLPLNGQLSLKHRLGIQLDPQDLLHRH